MRVMWDGPDEGILLEGARRIAEGQLPGRDFLEPIGPWSFYWMAGFFHLFGTSIATARGLLLATGVVIALAMYHLALRAGAQAGLCAAFFIVLVFSEFPVGDHHHDSDMLCLLSLCAFVEWQRGKSVLLLTGCGALAGAATLTSQSEGLLFLAGLVLSAVLVRRIAGKWIANPLLYLIGSYLAVLTAVGAFYYSQGALHDLVWANVIWPASRYLASVGCPYLMNLTTPLRAIREGTAEVMPKYLSLAATAFVGLPFLIVAALPFLLTGSAAWLRTRAFPSVLIPFWCCGIALWFSELHRPDLAHLVWGSAIGLILGSALWRRMTDGPGLTFLLSGALGVLAALYLFVALSAQTPVETRRGRLAGQSQDAALAFLLSHTQPGDDIFVYPYFPLYYFLSNTRNPTRVSAYLYGWNPPDQFTDAVNRLEAKRVRYALWDADTDLRILFPHYKSPPASEQIMERYLESHYHRLGNAGRFRIMERNR